MLLTSKCVNEERAATAIPSQAGGTGDLCARAFVVAVRNPDVLRAVSLA
jgi:hypothetical protein